MMGTPDDIIDLSILYMRIYFLVCPPAWSIFWCGDSAPLDSRRPMYYLTIAGIVNVIFNLFLL